MKLFYVYDFLTMAIYDMQVVFVIDKFEVYLRTLKTHHPGNPLLLKQR